MPVEAFQINPGTTTNILVDNTGGTSSSGTIIPIYKLSMDGQGTYTNANLFTGTLPQVNNIGNLPNLPGGTIGSVIGVGSVSGLSNLPGGTLGSVVGVGSISGLSNLPQGSINVTAGTVGGKGASGAAISGNPIPVGGTDGGGTTYAFLTDTKGQQYIGGGTIGTVTGIGSVSGLSNIPGGSIVVTAGTIGTVLSVGTLPNIPGGSIAVTAGTIGTVLSVGTLPNIPGGSIAVTAGTVASVGTMGTLGTLLNLGSVTNVGQVYNAGTLQAGTINTGTINLGSVVKITPAASAGSFTAAGSVVVTGSQLDYAGFDIGGTFVGTVFTEAQIGTSAWFAIPYVTNLGVVGTSFTANGDYFVSMAGVDGVRARLTYSSGTLTYNARQSNFFAPVDYILGGSIGNIGVLPNLPGGTLNLVTTVSNLTNGSVAVTAGTVSAGTINTGTINVGTINVATVTAGTINTGTLNAGTVNVATITAGTINTGTFRGDARTTQNIVSYGSQVGFSGAGAATIVGSASVGAGTSLWMNDVSIFNLQSGAGTFILGFGTTQQGTNVLLRAPIGTNGAVGIEKPFPKAVNAGMTNQDLVLSATGAGTVDLSISYFISA